MVAGTEDPSNDFGGGLLPGKHAAQLGRQCLLPLTVIVDRDEFHVCLRLIMTLRQETHGPMAFGPVLHRLGQHIACCAGNQPAQPVPVRQQLVLVIAAQQFIGAFTRERNRHVLACQ